MKDYLNKLEYFLSVLLFLIISILSDGWFSIGAAIVAGLYIILWGVQSYQLYQKEKVEEEEQQSKDNLEPAPADNAESSYIKITPDSPTQVYVGVDLGKDSDKSTYPDGIYGLTKTGNIKAAAQVQDDELADIEYIIIKNGNTCIKTPRKQIQGEYTFEKAQKKTAELGEGWRPFTRHEWLDIYDMRFKGLNEFMRRLGMEGFSGWYWTSEEDADPQCSAAHACYAGSGGVLYFNLKRNGYRVVAVIAFQI